MTCPPRYSFLCRSILRVSWQHQVLNCHLTVAMGNTHSDAWSFTCCYHKYVQKWFDPLLRNEKYADIITVYISVLKNWQNYQDYELILMLQTFWHTCVWTFGDVLSRESWNFMLLQHNFTAPFCFASFRSISLDFNFGWLGLCVSTPWLQASALIL